MSVSGILEALARASLQGALFVAVVWIVCRLFPRLPAAVRCGLWWAACLKMLLGLIALPAVRVPLLPAAEVAPVESVRVVAPSRTLTPGPSPFPSLPPSQGEGKQEAKKEEIDWRGMGILGIFGMWVVGLAVLGFRALGQLRYTRGVIRRAEPLREGWVRTAFAEICGRLGLRRSPGLRGSGEVRTPLVTGLRRPVVLIPRSGLERLTPAEVSMTLCHELVHLRRRDLWLGWVPALAQRIFFFHPLAALAAREYAIAREAACDAEVLRVLGSAPQAYGRLLLRWGVAPRETGLAAAGASPSLQNLKRRLQMLQQNSPDKRRFSGWWWLAGAAILIGLAPLQIVAQERTPQAEEAAPAAEAAPAPEAPEMAETAETPAAAPAPEATPAPVALPGTPAIAPAAPAAAPSTPAPAGLPVPAVAPRAATPQVPGTPAPAAAPRALPAAPGTPVPMAAPRAVPAPGTPAPAMAAPRAPQALSPMTTPRPAVAPMAAPAPVARLAGMTPPPAPPAPPRPPAPPKPPKHSSYSYHTGDHGDSWVLLSGGSDSVSMSGDTDDLKKVKRLRGDSKEGLLWFRQSGKEYVVRDPALLKKAQGLFEPQAKLGAKQGELGAKQGELGAKQGELGARQGALGAELGTLAADRARRGNDADDRDLEKREKELQDKMEELGRKQEELGRLQEELGSKQEELGRQQEELGRKAEKEFRTLVSEAVRSGAAQEVR